MDGGQKDIIQKMVGQQDKIKIITIMKYKIKQIVRVYMIFWNIKLYQYIMIKMKKEFHLNGQK